MHSVLPTEWRPVDNPCRTTTTDKVDTFSQNGATQTEIPITRRKVPRNRRWFIFCVIFPALRHPATTPMNLQNDQFLVVGGMDPQQREGRAPFLGAEWPSSVVPSCVCQTNTFGISLASKRRPRPNPRKSSSVVCEKVVLCTSRSGLWRFSASSSRKFPADQPA